ncbi:MAG: hypothetical protein JWN17_2564 [Frankiales bacterium]|nr:hypothetical protein [Frankiales bacterium]
MDEDLHRRIDELVDDEHALRSRAAGNALGDAERARLRSLEDAADRTWDLLRQRDAKRDAGLDPDSAAERANDMVEGYLS